MARDRLQVPGARRDLTLHGVPLAGARRLRQGYAYATASALAGAVDPRQPDEQRGQIELEPGFADRLREKYETLVPYEEMLHYQARLLGSQYSRPELRQLLTFYRTKLGRKSVPFLHDLMASSLQRAALQVQSGLPGALAELRPLVHRLPSAGGKAQPGDGKAQPGQDAQADSGDGSPSAGESGQGAGPPPTDDKSL